MTITITYRNDYTIKHLCRVPEEAPQEIADLVFRCTASEADTRPEAHECAGVIARYLHDVN